MGKENEDYLDSLLNAVQGEIPHDAEDASEPEGMDSMGQDSMGLDSMDSMDMNSDGFLGDPFEERKAKRKERKRKPKRDASDALPWRPGDTSANTPTTP